MTWPGYSGISMTWPSPSATWTIDVMLTLSQLQELGNEKNVYFYFQEESPNPSFNLGPFSNRRCIFGSTSKLYKKEKMLIMSHSPSNIWMHFLPEYVNNENIFGPYDTNTVYTYSYFKNICVNEGMPSWIMEQITATSGTSWMELGKKHFETIAKKTTCSIGIYIKSLFEYMTCMKDTHPFHHSWKNR